MNLEIAFKNRIKSITGENKTWWNRSSFEDGGGWKSAEDMRKDRMRHYSSRPDKYNVRTIDGGFVVYRRTTSMSQNDFQVIRLVN